MLRLLDRGLSRILYVDLDAHHADGVEAAFADDERVLVCSVHEAGRWPFTGTASTRGARNFPVPPGFNDSELDFLVDRALVPIAGDFAPQALVLQCGADALAEDPMSKLALANGAIWRAVGRACLPLAPRVLVLGGGGYNPWAVARCWTGIWAVLNGYLIPAWPCPTRPKRSCAASPGMHSQGRNPPTSIGSPPWPIRRAWARCGRRSPTSPRAWPPDQRAPCPSAPDEIARSLHGRAALSGQMESHCDSI